MSTCCTSGEGGNMALFSNYFLILSIISVFLLLKVSCAMDDIMVPPTIVTMSRFIKDLHRIDGRYHPKFGQDFFIVVDNLTFLTGQSELPPRNYTSFIRCSQAEIGTQTVELVNSTRLFWLLTPDPGVTSRLVEGQCLVVLFYSPKCPFSCNAAPHFNALPRVFPHLQMVAIDAIQDDDFNPVFEITGVPRLILFHNGMAVAQLNDAVYNLEMFVKFITKITGINPAAKISVRSYDFKGPVPTALVREIDYVLWLAWAVILLTLAYAITRHDRWRAFINAFAAIWWNDIHPHND